MLYVISVLLSKHDTSKGTVTATTDYLGTPEKLFLSA